MFRFRVLEIREMWLVMRVLRQDDIIERRVLGNLLLLLRRFDCASKLTALFLSKKKIVATRVG